MITKPIFNSIFIKFNTLLDKTKKLFKKKKNILFCEETQRILASNEMLKNSDYIISIKKGPSNLPALIKQKHINKLKQKI